MIYKVVSIAVLFFCINLNTTTAQVFKGTVVDDETGEPVPFSTIFLTNTTLGVSADAEGNFTLEIPRGNYEVVTRMLGYELMVFTLRTDEMKPFYQIRLKPDARQLREIKIEGERDALWYRNLEIFKDYFLGTSANAEKCKILNPEVLILDSDSKKGTLIASAVDVLVISNPNLGYEIDYVLTHFKLDSTSNEVYFQGYPSYRNLPKYSSKIPRRIVKNREKAYKGSIHHFLKTMYDGDSAEEGYLVREIRKVPNPERPSDEEIDSARVKMNQTKDFAEKEMLYRNFVRRERLPKTVEEMASDYSDTNDFISKQENGELLLQFNHLLEVTYTKEKVESAYNMNVYDIPKNQKSNIIIHYSDEMVIPKYQKSIIRLNVPSTTINHQGTTYNPFDIFLMGYMGWEKMGDMMPIDFIP